VTTSARIRSTICAITPRAVERVLDAESAPPAAESAPPGGGAPARASGVAGRGRALRVASPAADARSGSHEVATTIRPARWPDDLPVVRGLFVEYPPGLGFDPGFRGLEVPLPALPGKYVLRSAAARAARQVRTSMRGCPRCPTSTCCPGALARRVAR